MRRSTSHAAARTQGFTLIEIVITVAIIAILASVALPRYQLYVLKAKTSEAVSFLAITKTQQFVNLSHQDCFLELAPDPPALPGAALGAWSFATTNPARLCPAPILTYTFQDVGIAPISRFVHYQYACHAQYRGLTGASDEFACSALGDLDGDGQNYELVYCTDQLSSGKCIADPQGTVSLFPNDLVAVSSAGVF